jgi:hypothetical protein
LPKKSSLKISKVKWNYKTWYILADFTNHLFRVREESGEVTKEIEEKFFSSSKGGTDHEPVIQVIKNFIMNE